MSKWWALRLIWLGFGLMTAVIGILPEAAGVLIAILGLIYGVAWVVLLVLWGIAEIGDAAKAAQARADLGGFAFGKEIFPGFSLDFQADRGTDNERRPGPGWLLSQVRFAGQRFKAHLTASVDPPDPVKTALVWDSSLFLGAVALSAVLIAVVA
jgi:hypothetical protein